MPRLIMAYNLLRNGVLRKISGAGLGLSLLTSESVYLKRGQVP